MHVLKKLTLLAGAIVLTACATATPYQASTQADARNGFSEMKIENDRIRITFDGNNLTKRDTVETYLLYRAAELTKENGYDYFTLTERDIDKKSRLVSNGFADPYFGYFGHSYYHPRFGWSSPYHSSFYGSRFGYGHRFSRFGFGYSAFGGSPFGWGNDFDYREVTRYRATAEVKFGRGTKPLNANNAFSANEVLQNLSEKIIYPEVEA